MPRARLQSLFTQDLDRALFVAYFVGAVVPLVVLAGVVHRFALPGLEGSAAFSVIGLAAGAALLSLAGYFAVRRLANHALVRMDADNARLEQLLATSRSLASASHREEVAAVASDCARALAKGSSAGLFLRSEKSGALEQEGFAGDVMAFDNVRGPLLALADDALCAGDAAQWSEGTATALALPVASRATPGVFVVLRRGGAAARFEESELGVLDTLAALTAVALENADLQLTQRNFFAHVTDMVVMALDAHVDRRSGHATQVAKLANVVGRELGLGEDAIRRLHFAALLHDLGMLKVPVEHQRDPAHFRKHPVLGARMLSHIRLWKDAAPIVLHHHEHWDGTGYPSHLVGDAIPVESRIILVVDAFDAMTRDDTHRRALRLGEALQELRDGMGGQFDPAVVRAFLEVHQRGELPPRD